VLGWRSDLRPNLAALYDLWDARVYDPMHPMRANSFVGTRLYPRYRSGRYFQFREDRLDQPLMSFLGVAHVLGRPQGRMPPPWQSVHLTPSGRIWHNPEAMGLFHLPARVDRVATDDEALAHALANADFRLSVAVADPGGALRGGAQSGSVATVRPRSNGFDVAVATPTGGALTSSVSWAPGWRATADGRELPVLCANSGFLAVALPPGATTVQLDYRPAGWRWGLVTAGVTAMLLVVVAVASRRRWRVTPR
jgi:hypothetical protein